MSAQVRSGPRPIHGLLARHPIVSFVVLAYAGSWILRAPWWLARNGLGFLPYDLPVPAVLLLQQAGLFGGPFAAALLLTHVTEGSVRPLLSRLVWWRVDPLAWAVALVLVPITVALSYVWSDGLHGTGTDAGGLAIQAVGMYLVFVLGGPLQEELGWRGFALPRLQGNWPPAVAAVILGVVWCFWHTPQFFTREWDTPRGSAWDLLAFLTFTVAASVVLAWATNVGRGSVLIAILAHNALNWTLALAPVLTGRPVTTLWPAALGLSALAAAVLLVTRGRLGANATCSPPSVATPAQMP